MGIGYMAEEDEGAIGADWAMGLRELWGLRPAIACVAQFIWFYCTGLY